jgi:hypothetical protein
VDLPLDDRRVGHDLPVDLEEEVRASDRVLPILVGEPFIVVSTEGADHQCPDRVDLGRRQLGGRESAQATAIG